MEIQFVEVAEDIVGDTVDRRLRHTREDRRPGLPNQRVRAGVSLFGLSCRARAFVWELGGLGLR